MKNMIALTLGMCISTGFVFPAAAAGCEVENTFFYRSSTACPEDVQKYLVMVGDCKALEREITIKRGESKRLGNMIELKLRCANLSGMTKEMYKKYQGNRAIITLMEDYQNKFTLGSR